jgi:hypothetical protein
LAPPAFPDISQDWLLEMKTLALPLVCADEEISRMVMDREVTTDRICPPGMNEVH